MDTVTLNLEVNKSSPEFSYHHMICKFFEEDPDIDVGAIDEQTYEFTITVHNRRKFEILQEALSVPKNAKRVKVTVQCDAEKTITDEDIAYLLDSNPYFSRFDGTGALMKYILMKPDVVQYYDDIANNPWGTAVRTAEDVAKELFHGSHCNITTDIKPTTNG